jgi:1L-myo-inositol 1-phosphate cytidylyltransferase
MDGLIIAAGYGSRLRELSDSKPLTPIAGVPLIELGVRRLAACGIARVVIVTGHTADAVESFVRGLGMRTGIEVECARVADWSLPNGHSVIAGASRITGDYILQMADHIFAPAIVSGLMQQGSAERGVTLAIDRRTNSPLIDPDDATWVQTGEDGLITAIGKTIPHYDAVDCGAFLATPELAAAIAGAIAEGQAGSLSEGMQRLADAGRAATWDVGDDEADAWWLDVDDPRAHALAEAEAPARLADLYPALTGI